MLAVSHTKPLHDAVAQMADDLYGGSAPKQGCFGCLPKVLHDAKPAEQATLNTHFQKLYRFFYKLLPPLFYLNCGGRPFITRDYNPDNYFSSSSSRLVILLRLIARVEALWNSAEVVGWIIPPTPRSISIRLNDTIKR